MRARPWLAFAQRFSRVLVHVERLAQLSVGGDRERGHRAAVVVHGDRDLSCWIHHHLIRLDTAGARLVQERQRAGFRVDGIRAHGVTLHRVAALPVHRVQKPAVRRHPDVCRVRRFRHQAH